MDASLVHSLGTTSTPSDSSLGGCATTSAPSDRPSRISTWPDQFIRTCFGTVPDHFDNFTAPHPNDPVGHIGYCGIVSDDDRGRTKFLIDLLDRLQYHLARRLVQRSGGFVAQEYLGTFGYGPCNGNPLLLAARKLGGTVVGAISQSHHVQRLLRWYGRIGYIGNQFYVFSGG